MEEILITALGTHVFVLGLRLLIERYDDRIAWKSLTKYICALVGATGLTLLQSLTVDGLAVNALAGAGLATVIHRTHRWLGAMGDLYRLHVLNGGRRR